MTAAFWAFHALAARAAEALMATMCGGEEQRPSAPAGAEGHGEVSPCLEFLRLLLLWHACGVLVM